MAGPERRARRRLVGAAAIEAALAAGDPVQWLALPEGELDEKLAALEARAAAAGARVTRVAARRGRRLGSGPGAGRDGTRGEPVALVGPSPRADLDAVMARGGAVWLLVGASYPGNVGTAIRTAEGSGADAVYVDSDFDHEQRREARRASMRSDRYLPVAWEEAGRVLGAARRAGKRLVAVEDSGSRAPWQVDLRGPRLLLVGGEADGIPDALLRRCDDVVRIPMAGFVSSYNLQAAVAAVAAERLRQEAEAATGE